MSFDDEACTEQKKGFLSPGAPQMRKEGSPVQFCVDVIQGGVVQYLMVAGFLDAP